MPISAVDAIAPAFQHMRMQLTKPFRFWQWTRLALVGFLAGEMGSGGGNFNVPSNFNLPQHGSSRHFENFASDVFPNIDPAILGSLIAVLVIAFLVFLIVFMYIGSVMRFILFDSILARECHIRAGWRRRTSEGWRLFLWQLGLGAIMLGVLVILVGIPLGIAYMVGWLSDPKEHVAALVLGGILLFFLFFIIVIAAAVVHVCTKDFVVPQMALEGVGAIEGWRRLLPMMGGEKSGYLVYILMKIVMAIGASIVVFVAMLFVGLFFAVPAVILAILAGVAGSSAGLTWNVYTITLLIVIGSIVLAVFLYVMALISVPVTVFFPAYSIYYFAARYRPLSVALYGAPPAPPEPPPLQFAPEPIG